jgi:hypothetical protein
MLLRTPRQQGWIGGPTFLPLPSHAFVRPPVRICGLHVLADSSRRLGTGFLKASGDVVGAVSDGVLMLDVAGPVQVLHWAGRRIRFASPDGTPVRTDVGVPLGVDGALGELGGSIQQRHPGLPTLTWDAIVAMSGWGD